MPNGSATGAAVTNTSTTSPMPIATPTSSPSPTFISSDGPGASPSYDPVFGQEACRLVAVDTIETVLGMAGLTWSGYSGDADTGICTYLAGEEVIVRVSYSASRVAADFEAYVGQSVPVDGIGDAAIWVDDPGFLYIRVGGRAAGIQLAEGLVPPDELQATSITLGRAAIDGL